MTIYLCGTVGTLTAIPDSGWSFSHWSDDLSGSIGLISLSGPVACLLLGGIFAMLLNFGYEQLGSLGVMVCMTKATFDLIPTPPMNGKEIFDWNKIIWLMLILPSAAAYLFFVLSF